MGASHSNTTTTISTAKITRDSPIYKSETISTWNGKSQESFKQEPPKLKGILKNKELVKNERRPQKLVELYIQKGDQWTVLRVPEEEAETKKRELKSDKTIKRIYTKPVHDTTFLHFKAI